MSRAGIAGARHMAAAAARPSFAAAPRIVCFPFTGGVAGGSHISAYRLIRSLDPRRFTPLVVLHHDTGEVAALLRRDGIPYELAPSPSHFGHAPGTPDCRGVAGLARAAAAQIAFARFLVRRGVSIVHTNEGPMHATWALPARAAGARLLWHHRSSADARGLRWLAPLLATHVAAVSRYALSASRRLRSSSVVYSPFDVDAARVDRAACRRMLDAELGLAPGTRVVGYFGNFVARKRPALFVDVIAELAGRRNGPPVVGLMFGAAIHGGDDAVQARIAHHALGDGVRLMGFRYPATRWMAACDVHAVTAVGEPFGRSLIEAMLLGTPVVAVDSGGNAEAIRDGQTGLLVRPDDAGAMARAIAGLLDRPAEAETIARTARAEARLRFGGDRHVREISAIYGRMLANGRDAAPRRRRS